MSPNSLLSLNRIRESLRRLGVKAGQVVMLHASLRAIGPVEGGPRGLLNAILDVLTIEGSLMMLVGSKGAIYDIGDMSKAEKKAALAARAAFDPDQTAANPDWGVVGAALLNLEGSHRSRHPDYSFAAQEFKEFGISWLESNLPGPTI